MPASRRFMRFASRTLVNLAGTLALVLAFACADRHPAERRQAPQASARASAARALASAEVPALPVVVKSQVSAAERRAACEFGAGATPSQTLDSDEPRGAEIPIDHFVIVMQENRSFDHYFQGLPAAGQPDAEVAPRDFHNKDPKTGKQVGIFLQKVLCSKDVRHDWNSAHLQYDDGKMDGFVLTSNPKGARALAYYDATSLGYYYALANTFAIGDHYFASILAPTWPNRMFFHAASSFGHIGNTPPPDEGVRPSLFRELEQK
ncbi:MAG TPA: alkaline phosphatase family protein, partial [Polyangiaceae bacterium]